MTFPVWPTFTVWFDGCVTIEGATGLPELSLFEPPQLVRTIPKTGNKSTIDNARRRITSHPLYGLPNDDRVLTNLRVLARNPQLLVIATNGQMDFPVGVPRV